MIDDKKYGREKFLSEKYQEKIEKFKRALKLSMPLSIRKTRNRTDTELQKNSLILSKALNKNWVGEISPSDWEAL